MNEERLLNVKTDIMAMVRAKKILQQTGFEDMPILAGNKVDEPNFEIQVDLFSVQIAESLIDNKLLKDLFDAVFFVPIDVEISDKSDSDFIINNLKSFFLSTGQKLYLSIMMLVEESKKQRVMDTQKINQLMTETIEKILQNAQVIQE